MLGSIGLPELIFIMVLALLIFGPKRLPEIGRTIGKGLGEFRRASNDLRRTIDTEILAVDEERRLPTAPPPGPTPRPAAMPEMTIARNAEDAAAAEPAAANASAAAVDPVPAAPDASPRSSPEPPAPAVSGAE